MIFLCVDHVIFDVFLLDVYLLFAILLGQITDL